MLLLVGSCGSSTPVAGLGFRAVANVCEPRFCHGGGGPCQAPAPPGNFYALTRPRPTSAPGPSAPAHEAAALELGELRARMDEAERRRIVAALEACGGNQTKAARMLGMSRGTLVARLETYKLPRPRK